MTLMTDEKLILCNDKDFAEFYWHVDQRYLYVKGHEFRNSEEYRQALQAQINLLEQKNGRKVIFEIPGHLSLSLEDQFYTSHYYIPEMVKKGLKYMAIIQDENNKLEKIFLDRIQGSLQEGLVEFEFFKDHASAEKWLATK